MNQSVERLRNFYLAVFFLLIITIIFTPVLVSRGLSIFGEELLESLLLFVQVSVAWRVFRFYEQTVNRREGEIRKLEKEYQGREKELLEAFAYLGKVNVQVSLIKSFLQKLKAPSSLKEAESYINEILEIALALSGKKWITLRAIDPKTLQTISEYWARAGNGVDTQGIKIGNKDLVKWENDPEEGQKKGFFVFGSSGSDISRRKIYLVFLNGQKVDPDIEEFLRAAANQCAVLLSLFDLGAKNGFGLT